MFKSKLFGYSKKQVDHLLQQIDQDFHSEEEMLQEKIKNLEESCQLLNSSNENDSAKLKKARSNYRYYLNTINHLNKTQVK
jgi:cell division septum initiation protein DivIVA